MSIIPISQPLLGDAEKEAVLAALESGQLAQGPRVRQFEEAFAEMCGVRETVATSSGTAALIVALLAHGIGPEDEVITSTLTFVATANAVLFTGARPVFADVSDTDFNIDAALIGPKITARTKALLPVHLFGHPCDMKAIMELAQRYHLTVIEDACQAHGAAIGEQKTGSFGTGCFSFYPTKNITTAEGGMITTNDPQVAERARLIRDHGQGARYQSQITGYNFRMTEIAAAIGMAQLTRLQEFNERRRANACYLSQNLRSVITPAERPGCYHVYHQYTVRLPLQQSSAPPPRDALAAHLQQSGIQTAVYYPTPVHQQPLYRDLGYGESLPIAERLSQEVLSLPVHPALTTDDLETIVRAVNQSPAPVGGQS